MRRGNVCYSAQPQARLTPATCNIFIRAENILLINSSLASLSHLSLVPSQPLKAVEDHSQEPASFKARREALCLTTAQLGGLLGISSSDVEVIETIYVGEEVAFLHNLTLSVLELGGIDSMPA